MLKRSVKGRGCEKGLRYERVRGEGVKRRGWE